MISNMDKNLISQAIELTSLTRLAKACGVTYQSVKRWEAKGRVPRTDWTGETDYASRIEEATGGRITRAQLLDLKSTAPASVTKPQQDMDQSHA